MYSNGKALRWFSVLLSALMFNISYVQAERYSVEQDSFGNYSAKKVESSEAHQDMTVSKGQAKAEQVIPEQSAELSSATDENPDQVETPEQEPKELSIFEMKYLEAELAERERVLKALKGNFGESSDYDATAVNPEDFVDSEAALRSANKVDIEKSPYYVTVGADGIPQTVFYDPAVVKEILFKQRNEKIQFTDTQVYKKMTSNIALPEEADPLAVGILRGTNKEFESYFDIFAKRCCDDLPNINTPKIQFGESYYFTLNDDDLPYRFSEGDSRFILMRLPDLEKDIIPIRLKTFIRKYSKRNIDKGVFFPQLVTLNSEREPVRVMTGPLLKYQDETWTTHAYLKGIFPISQSPELDERYLLVNTTKETLNSSSTIELPESEDEEARTVFIKHMNEGSFEIEILEYK
ncbi:MAG: MalM family protein [Oleiphilus sp.]